MLQRRWPLNPCGQMHSGPLLLSVVELSLLLLCYKGVHTMRHVQVMGETAGAAPGSLPIYQQAMDLTMLSVLKGGRERTLKGAKVHPQGMFSQADGSAPLMASAVLPHSVYVEVAIPWSFIRHQGSARATPSPRALTQSFLFDFTHRPRLYSLYILDWEGLAASAGLKLVAAPSGSFVWGKPPGTMVVMQPV
eukprot:1137955-Pelagomonas_calceolata.AAC.2